MMTRQGSLIPAAVVGATYQLDRALYPDELVICSTGAAMTRYHDADAANDTATTSGLLFEVETMDDFKNMKAADGCTTISSFSQATITAKGAASHKAGFAAFPLTPMWGY